MQLQETKQLFSVELYDSYLPSPLLEEINEIISTSGIKEPFDFMRSKYYVVAKNGDEIVGLVTYGEENVEGLKLPRFMHIVIVPKYRRTKLAYKMLIDSEQEIKKLGYTMIVCFIRFDLVERDVKIKYAIKDGYLKYQKNEVGEFFYKMIK